MKRSLMEDLDKLADITSKVTSIIKFQTRKHLQAVAIFDLADSTGLKLKIGHDETIKKMFLHNQICSQIIKRFKGQIIKDMGDGLLAMFNDPLDACLAAINIQIATEKYKIPSKAALTLGVIEEAKINKNVDIFGTTVDRCARIEKFTFPNQILIDSSLYDVVKSLLTDYNDIRIGKTMQIFLKGYGKCDLYEICSNKFQLINSLNNPNYININDGLSLDEKLRFISNAKNDVVELGLDVEEFASNLDVYKGTIKKLLEQGVSFKIIIIIPRLDVFIDNKPKTEQQIFQEMVNVKRFTEDFSKQQFPGRFEFLLCQDIPMYHAICVDRHSEDSTMIISNHINGIKQELCPVLQFSKISSPETFKIYLDSIEHIISASVRQ